MTLEKKKSGEQVWYAFHRTPSKRAKLRRKLRGKKSKWQSSNSNIWVINVAENQNKGNESKMQSYNEAEDVNM